MTTIIANAFPVDIELILFSQIIAFAIAIPLALVASRRPNRLFDRLAGMSTFGMLAMPAFVIGPILALVFAVKIHLFPATGRTVFHLAPADEHPRHGPAFDRPRSRLDRGLLPAACEVTS